MVLSCHFFIQSVNIGSRSEQQCKNFHILYLSERQVDSRGKEESMCHLHKQLTVSIIHHLHDLVCGKSKDRTNCTRRCSIGQECIVDSLAYLCCISIAEDKAV